MMKSFDCKPAEVLVRSGDRTIMQRLALHRVAMLLAVVLVTVFPPGAAIAAGPDDVPPLTLETLYHPEQKFDYGGEAPATQWIAGDQDAGNQTELIVRREDNWMTVDLETGAEAVWPVVDQLERQLSALDGLKPDQARSAAMRIGGQMKTRSATQLVRVGKALAVVNPSSPARWLTQDASRWDNATLDPLARRVAYTTDGDLYLRDLASGRSLRLTSDGSDTLLNGILDWMYQEEIFGRGNYRGFWFSHDGEWLAMLRIDISQIPPYVLTAASADRGEALVRRYSKAGDPIPHATLQLWDLRQADEGQIPPPFQIEHSDPRRERIITGVWWYPDRKRLLYTVSDRRQTWRELRRVEVESWGTRSRLVDREPRGSEPRGEPQGTRNSERLLREESPAWVEPPAEPGFFADGSIAWRSELPSGYQRLYRISEDGSVVTPLSPEAFNVEDFFVARDGSFVLLTGDAKGGTVERQVYRVDLGPLNGLDPVGSQRPATSGSESGAAERADSLELRRVTTAFGWNESEFSPEGHAAVIRHSTPTSPPSVSVISTSATDTESNSDEGIRVPRPIALGGASLKLPGGMIEPELFRIEIEDGTKLPAMLVRPRTATSDEGVKTPVVIEVYGGPRTPIVTARWGGARSLYREWLARHGIASLVVDNRSSGGRGLAETWAIRHRVGEIERKDLLSATEWLRTQSWVDPQRLALRGWSFGGFLTLLGMTHSQAFTAGVAGGSVADWREYDSFYTERYMGLPSENPDGYRDTAPIHAAGDLHGRLLLIHGELDDNVHPSNTLRMVDALQEAGKMFDLMIYPGAAHGIHDPQQVWHLARLTDGFLREQLGVLGDKAK